MVTVMSDKKIEWARPTKFIGYCEYCEGAKPLVVGESNDKGIAISSNRLRAYGYDVHGHGSNGLSVTIKFCPMCGRKL